MNMNKLALAASALLCTGGIVWCLSGLAAEAKALELDTIPTDVQTVSIDCADQDYDGLVKAGEGVFYDCNHDRLISEATAFTLYGQE